MPETPSTPPTESPELFETTLLEKATALSVTVTEERQKAADTHNRLHGIEQAVFELIRRIREMGR